MVGAAVIGLYAVRKPLAQGWIDNELKKRGVVAQYQLTQLDPDHQRLEHVIVGDPAHPDLTADWVETETSVGLFGAALTGVRASGVRVHGVLDKDGSLHFGTLDKLRTGGGGPFTLPDLGLDLSDARLALDTPYGAVNARLDGKGNLAGDFAGKLAVTTGAVAANGCALSPIAGNLDVAIQSGAPHLSGPLRSDSFSCKGNFLLRPQLNADAILSADFKEVRGTATLTVDHVVSPLLPTLARGLDVAKGTPLAPFGAQYGAAIAALGAGGQVSSAFSSGATRDVVLTDYALHSRSGAVITAASGARATATPAGQISFDGATRLSGGGFPTAELIASGTSAKFAGTATIAPLTAPNTRLALTPVQFSHDTHGTRIYTAATFDGPVAGGTVHGLTVPITGLIGTTGGFALANPCTPVRLDSLVFSSLTLGKTATNVCLKGQEISINAPRLAGRTGGEAFDVAATRLSYGLTSKALALEQISGHYGPARLSLARAAYHVGSGAFDAATLQAAVGAVGHESTLSVDTVNGVTAGSKLHGSYTNASGSITNVPLQLDHSSGTWQFADAALALNGNLNVADTTPRPNERFEPLVVPDVVLHYAKGVVTATGTLREPKSGAFVSRVTLNHTIATETGAANIDILELPLLTFNKALQPDQLTLFTKGLIADVKGSISGQGRIRWTARGVTSDGDFETKHIDLAALFGVASGLSGKVHFTDLLGMVTAPHQELRVASANPGIIVNNGVVHYQLLPNNHLAIEDGHFPFADGQLSLEPTVMDLNQAATRRLTFTVKGVDAAKFITQSGFEDIAATGVFDGTLPLIFDSTGGRIEGGELAVRAAGGTVSYIGAVSNTAMGRFGTLAFDALKSMRYHGLKIELNGPLDSEMVTLVKLSGTNESPKSAKRSYLLKQITGIPFKFNIRISAPFRSLFNTAKNLDDPSALVQGDLPANLKASAPPPVPVVHPPAIPIQPKESEPVR